MKLDVGSGPFPRLGYTSVDISGKADFIIDLEKGSLPFGDNSIEAINASHILEHIHNLIPLINECWRVLQLGGYIEVIVPKFPHTDAIVDPTHVRWFVPHTFHYFAEEHPLREAYKIKPWHLLNIGESENEVYCKMEPVK